MSRCYLPSLFSTIYNDIFTGPDLIGFDDAPVTSRFDILLELSLTVGDSFFDLPYRSFWLLLSAVCARAMMTYSKTRDHVSLVVSMPSLSAQIMFTIKLNTIVVAGGSMSFLHAMLREEF